MTAPDISQTIHNELLRVQIQRHPRFSEWHDSLRPYALFIVNTLLREDVSPELIEFANEVPLDEWMQFQFMGIIGGGDADPIVSLEVTSEALGNILSELEERKKARE